MTDLKNDIFTSTCVKCDRLAGFLKSVRKDNPDYFGLPVPSFGDPNARLLIVGLAPGMHGANRTGRPFTGDYAGLLLYQTIFDKGFSNASESVHADDGLILKDCRITNAVRCLPPQNKPIGSEVNNCNEYLVKEINAVPKNGVVLALGAIAHSAVLKAVNARKSKFPFGHGNCHQLSESLTLLDSYHCSRYNTQTRRLTSSMFQDVFEKARKVLSVNES